MEGGFPYGDIIVIGAIAAFILLRYRAMLGEKSGRDVSEFNRARPIEDLEPVIQLEGREAARKAETGKKTSPADEPTAFAAQFSAMRAIDSEFSVPEFTEGARNAFEMVIEAYNESDHETLRMLLSERIYQQFKASLEENEKAGRKVQATLLAIVKSEITAAKLQGNKATLTVDFLSEQVPLVKNEAGEIIEGSVSNQEAVEDQWVFERNLASSDPSWKITET